MNVIHEIEAAQMKPADKIPQFAVGDTVRVHFRIVEGEKERIQVFEGVVIARKGGEGADARFTVRRVAFNEGVERVFPLHSPRVERVEVKREGHVRRAKLFYLRERSGKAARVKARARGAAPSGLAAEVVDKQAVQEPSPAEAAEVAEEKEAMATAEATENTETKSDSSSSDD